MAYVTGTANSLPDLLAAIQNACTANGWTLSAGGALSKGTCFVELKIVGTYISIQGGTGVDGSGNLTGRADTTAGRIGAPSAAGNQVPIAPSFAYPMSYEVFVHTAPDEVYVVVNYATTFYEASGWGQSTMPGLSGSGNWYSGCIPPNYSGYSTRIGSQGPDSGAAVYGLVFPTLSGYGGMGVHHALDSATWAIGNTAIDWGSLFFREPNQWNQESILIPIRTYASRPSGFVSPVLECAHARNVCIANLSDGQVITLGTDRWKIYPWWNRSTPYSTDIGSGKYTGVCGHAIRYDGP